MHAVQLSVCCWHTGMAAYLEGELLVGPQSVDAICDDGVYGHGALGKAVPRLNELVHGGLHWQLLPIEIGGVLQSLLKRRNYDLQRTKVEHSTLPQRAAQQTQATNRLSRECHSGELQASWLLC